MQFLGYLFSVWVGVLLAWATLGAVAFVGAMVLARRLAMRLLWIGVTALYGIVSILNFRSWFINLRTEAFVTTVVVWVVLFIACVADVLYSAIAQQDTSNAG